MFGGKTGGAFPNQPRKVGCPGNKPGTPPTHRDADREPAIFSLQIKRRDATHDSPVQESLASNGIHTDHRTDRTKRDEINDTTIGESQVNPP